MANLRVDKITSTETFETTGSVQFDGSGDYLSLTNIADFRMGSDDFTVECWVYPVSSGANEGIVGIWEASSGRTWLIYLSSAVKPVFILDGDGSGGGEASASGPDALPLDTWTHLAGVRHGDYITLYVNGTSVAKVGAVTVYNNTSDPLEIGRFNSGNEFEGHISNLRIIKGKALYTSNFKPPMRELEVVPGTVLLACQSKTNTILEKTGKTITANGNAVANELTPGLLTHVPKDGAGSAITGSVEFNENDYLSIPDSDDFNMGTGDFTLECWVNSSNNSNYQGIFGSYDYDNSMVLLQISNTGVLRFVNPNDISVTGTTDMHGTGWHHIVMCRSGSTLRGFVNGIEEISTSYSASIDWGHSNNSIVIGVVDRTDYTNQYNYKGFISNLRLVRGTALYTHDFIPPTRELKKVPGTVLLCCQDPDNPLTEATGKTITPYGSLGDGSLGPELVTRDGVWTLTKGGSGATDWTVSDQGRSLAGTTVSGGYIRATYTLPKGDYLVSLRWTGGAFAVQDSTGYIVATDGTDTEFGASEDGAYSFYMTDTTSVVITGTSWSTAYTVDDISIKRIYRNNGASNFTPQVGDDRKVTFEGVTKINSDAYFYLPTGDTESREATGTYNAGTRAIFGAIELYPTAGDSIHYATIASLAIQ